MRKQYTLLLATLFATASFLLGQYSIQMSHDFTNIKNDSRELAKHSFLLGCKLGLRIENKQTVRDGTCATIGQVFNTKIKEILE